MGILSLTGNNSSSATPTSPTAISASTAARGGSICAAFLSTGVIAAIAFTLC